MTDSPLRPVVEMSASQLAYETRINVAMDFVEQHLAEKLTLDEMAGAASFSPFHFHRIFSAMVGETPSDHVRRVRTERAAALLLDQPGRTISDISANCGFGTPSAFARAFKAIVGQSPTQWRATTRRHDGQLGNRPNAAGTRSARASDRAVVEPSGLRRWTMVAPGLSPTEISVEHIEPIELTYLRHRGPFQGSSALFESLFTALFEALSESLSESLEASLHRSASEPTGTRSPTRRYALYHDDPEVTDDDRLRVSVAIESTTSAHPSPPLGRTSLGAGLHAVGRFELGPDDYGTAWRAMLGSWLPASGFEPSDVPYFERFATDATSARSSNEPRRVDICIPVQPLTVR